jgi:hypothetical protein
MLENVIINIGNELAIAQFVQFTYRHIIARKRKSEAYGYINLRQIEVSITLVRQYRFRSL